MKAFCGVIVTKLRSGVLVSTLPNVRRASVRLASLDELQSVLKRDLPIGLQFLAVHHHAEELLKEKLEMELKLVKEKLEIELKLVEEKLEMEHHAEALLKEKLEMELKLVKEKLEMELKLVKEKLEMEHHAEALLKEKLEMELKLVKEKLEMELQLVKMELLDANRKRLQAQGKFEVRG